MLRVPAWELAGFTYSTAADAPICWREWAFEFRIAKQYAADKHQADMLKGIGGGY